MNDVIRHDNIEPRRVAGRRRAAGLSLIELLLALAISAMLLTATMVALDASFMAYADASEQASAQAATRMITHRLVTLIRTSTAHGPLLPDAGTDPPVTLSGNTITSYYIELIDPNENVVRVEYRQDEEELWVITTPPGGGATIEQPLIGGVTACQFFAVRRIDDETGLWILDRATMDLTVMPGVDATLALENGHPQPIRVIASTAPRKLE